MSVRRRKVRERVERERRWREGKERFDASLAELYASLMARIRERDLELARLADDGCPL